MLSFPHLTFLTFLSPLSFSHSPSLSLTTPSSGYVGADLSSVCMEAAFRAIRETLPHIDIDADEGTLDPALLASIVIRVRQCLCVCLSVSLCVCV